MIALVIVVLIAVIVAEVMVAVVAEGIIQTSNIGPEFLRFL